ncbi:MAG TPA: TraR/DksA C4-type zinc finger protein [Nitrolancea sp.]|nr:TraR/DksA C4-type zinc finger protein [Nitrolancea sp.]
MDVFRGRLTQAFQETAGEIADIDDELQGLALDDTAAEGVDNHIGDDSDQLFERERLMTIRGELVDRRLAIQQALQKLDDGTYGICERCGKPIAPERLEALPFARYCLDCQDIIDRQGR